jgi:two-component system CheB/CheR fusion protein
MGPPKKTTTKTSGSKRQNATPARNQANSKKVLDGPAPDQPRFIVGIGASAGGLEAYSHLFPPLPPDTGMAFIVVQHLDPKHESLLAELISRMTRMPVTQAEEDMPVRPNRVYIIPPNANMALSQGFLKLVPRPELRGPYLTVDYLFSSLAEDQKEQAIGIVLSGTSVDGARGLEAIKRAGGITFAQDRKSAKYDYMPQSAIATGCVDFVLPPAEIAQELMRINHHPLLAVPGTAKPEELHKEEDKSFGQILHLLHRATGMDFSLYKQSTLQRRIGRRLVIHRLNNLKAYVHYLRETPAEIDTLTEDLFIKVTGFFRDPAAFEVLKEKFFPLIVPGKSPQAPIRVWVPGCATGEEAYSLAICWMEFLEERLATVPIQIFATDVSEKVIEKARTGLYPGKIAGEMSPERLSRFFTQTETGYEINKPIREMCVFARHNLIQDPPFSRVDFISCRNLLIYLEPELQKRVIPLMHYALNLGGFLMLGASETVGLSELFTLEDKKWKIYRKKSSPGMAKLDLLPSLRPVMGQDLPLKHVAGREKLWSTMDLFREADRYVCRRFAPAGVLINENREILQFRGETDPYLKPAEGQASLSLMKMAREGLAAGLHSPLQESLTQNRPVKREGLRLEYNRRFRTIDVEVVPLKLGPGQERYFLVLFEEAREAIAPLPQETEPAAEAPGPEGQDVLLIRQLREELATTKEYLQAVIEDLESRNEEMQATHVETLSLNEEFQTVNEELETAKEELQSANEELSTMNDELLNRNAELTQLTNDYRNLLASSQIPILMLDQDLKVRLITPAAGDTFNLFPADIGKSAAEINLRVKIPNMEDKVRQVMETLQSHSQEVQDLQGRWFALDIRPYRTMGNKIEGAVIALADIDTLKRSLTQVEESRHYAQTVVEAMRESLVLVDGDLRVKMANPYFYQTFQVSPQETEGSLLYELGNREWDIPKLRETLAQVVSLGSSFQNFLVEQEFPGIGLRTMLLNCCRAQRNGAEKLILLTIIDITDLKKAEESSKESERKLRVLTSRLFTSQERERHRISWELHDEIGQGLAALKLQLAAIAATLKDQKEKKTCEDALQYVLQIMRSIQNISLDLRPPVMEELGFTAAIKHLVSEFKRYFKTRCLLVIHGEPDKLFDELLPPERQILLYRVLEEALANIGRHAATTEAEVRIIRKGDVMQILVKDNGQGFDVEENRAADQEQQSVGLLAMEERVRMLGGTLNIWSKKGKGTMVSFSIPLKRNQPGA